MNHKIFPNSFRFNFYKKKQKKKKQIELERFITLSLGYQIIILL